MCYKYLGYINCAKSKYMASIYYAIYHEKSEQPKLLSRLKEGAAEQKNEQNRETSSVCEMRDA